MFEALCFRCVFLLLRGMWTACPAVYMLVDSLAATLLFETFGARKVALTMLALMFCTITQRDSLCLEYRDSCDPRHVVFCVLLLCFGRKISVDDDNCEDLFVNEQSEVAPESKAEDAKSPVDSAAAEERPMTSEPDTMVEENSTVVDGCKTEDACRTALEQHASCSDTLVDASILTGEGGDQNTVEAVESQCEDAEGSVATCTFLDESEKSVEEEEEPDLPDVEDSGCGDAEVCTHPDVPNKMVEKADSDCPAENSSAGIREADESDDPSDMQSAEGKQATTL